MSTKSTICHGDDFHFYSEVGDDYNVYLQLDKVALEECSLDGNRLRVCIPAAIWKKISQYSDIDLSFAVKTDDDITNMVVQKVDERISDMKESNEEEKLMRSLSGLLIYGDVDDNRDIQIASGIKYFLNKRNKELAIIKRYNKYEPIKTDSETP